MAKPTIERIEGQIMKVNAQVVIGEEGVVVIDGMLTVRDAEAVQERVAAARKPLLGVVVTHAHPDHYAGLAHIVGENEVPIVATKGVDRIIRRDDAIKEQIVAPMMGDQWPTRRIFPNQTVDDGAEVRFGDVTLRVRDIGPAESPHDSLWLLDERTLFAGDLVYSGMHAYLADGYWQQWIDSLDRLETELDADARLWVGHGPPGGRELLADQRRYVEAFVQAVQDNLARSPEERRLDVVSTMRRVIPGEDLLFLMELSIEPVAQQLGG